MTTETITEKSRTKNICISLRKEDLELMDTKIAELQAKGAKATRSSLIRTAVEAFNSGA